MAEVTQEHIRLAERCVERPYNRGSVDRAAKAIAEAMANHDALVEALDRCQTTLAMLTEPKHIRSSSVTHAWAQAVEAEQKARAALAAFRGQK